MAHSPARQAPLRAATPRRGPAQRAARFVRQFRNAPLDAKRAHVKTLIRDLLLHAGAEEAAASGVPAHRRAMLLAQHVLGRSSGRARPGAGSQREPVIRWLHADAVPWEGPLVSVVVPAELDATAVRAALARQTLERIEVVTWDASTRRVSFEGDSPATFILPEEVSLGSTLLGRYAWLAPAVALPAAYLALNVFALESEQLEFTVNAFGFLEDGTAAVAAGRIPGTGPDQGPLIVGHAELLCDGLTWSFDGPHGQHGNAVCARVVAHPSPAVLAPPARWTGRLRSTIRQFVATEASVVASHQTPRRVTHTIRPIDLGKAPGRGPALRENVLVFMPFLAVGGAETQTVEVLRRLRDRFRFVVATTELLAPALGSMLADYLDVAPAIYTLPEAVHRHVFLSATCEILARHAVGTLFVANGSTWIYDAASDLKARVPSLHLVNQVFDHEVGWINRYDPDLVRTFDRHIAPSQRILEAYVRKGVDPSRIDLIYPGVVPAAYAGTAGVEARAADLRTELGIGRQDRVVVMAARLHTQKRPLDFLALAQRFAPDEAMFLLVGDGPLAGEIDRQVARLSLPHLRRRPFHRPVSEVLALADVVTILSEYEGLPLVLLEAQALGTPVVGTDVGAIREALEWTGGGVTVPIGDLSAAERAVRTLLTARPDMTRASARVRERFDIDVTARGHAAAFLA